MITEIVEALVKAGATPAMILEAVRAAEKATKDDIGARRRNDAERQRRYRQSKKEQSLTGEMSTDVTLCRSDNCDPFPQTPYPVISNVGVSSSSKEKPPKGGKKKGSGDEIPEFAAWWETFPNKVGKAAVSKKYSQVVRSGRASPETLMAGIRAYIASKPADRPWCNPLTWLNQERWEDQPAASTNAALLPATPEAEREKWRAYWAEFGIDRDTEATPERREDWKDLLTVWFEHEIWPRKYPDPRHPQCLISKETVQKFADKFGWEAPRYRKPVAA